MKIALLQYCIAGFLKYPQQKFNLILVSLLKHVYSARLLNILYCGGITITYRWTSVHRQPLAVVQVFPNQGRKSKSVWVEMYRPIHTQTTWVTPTSGQTRLQTEIITSVDNDQQFKWFNYATQLIDLRCIR